MRTDTFKGVMNSAYGQPIKPLKFSGSYECYGPDKDNYTESDWKEALEEIRAAGKFPSPEDIVNFVNNAPEGNEVSSG